MVLPSLQSDGFSHGKLTKSRKSLVVKPILKKLHVHSHSERNSLDLDRGWDEQPMNDSPDLEYGYNDYGARDPDGLASDRRHLFSTGYTAAAPTAATRPKPTRDVSFTLSATELGSGSGTGGALINRSNTFSSTTHARSTSGASVATSTTSAGRNGSFVHPFQQNPRTSTPPLSYANSVASLDTTVVGQQREYNSIAEDEGDDEQPEQPQPQPYSYSATKKLSTSHLNSNTKPRRPSLTSSQRTSSQSDGMSLRVSMTRSNSGTPVLRPTQIAVSQSRSDLQPSPGSCVNDPFSVTTPLTISSPKTVSPTLSNASPISPFRTSLDMNNFRIRARSEIDTATRQEHVREARRRFEEKEREKEEKYAREQVRKRERADAKEALKYERAQTQRRKSSLGHGSVVVQRNSSGIREKSAFPGEDARAEDVQFAMPSRSKSAKQKTNSLWTAFMLWLRTRLIKLRRRQGKPISRDD